MPRPCACVDRVGAHADGGRLASVDAPSVDRMAQYARFSNLPKLWSQIRPEKGGVVLREAHLMRNIPLSLCPTAKRALCAFLKDKVRTSVALIGVFFARTFASDEHPEHFNFIVFACDEFGAAHAFLSKVRGGGTAAGRSCRVFKLE